MKKEEKTNYIRVSIENEEGKNLVLYDNKEIKVFIQGRKVKNRRIEGEPYAYLIVNISEDDETLVIKKENSKKSKFNI